MVFLDFPFVTYLNFGFASSVEVEKIEDTYKLHHTTQNQLTYSPRQQQNIFYISPGILTKIWQSALSVLAIQ